MINDSLLSVVLAAGVGSNSAAIQAVLDVIGSNTAAVETFVNTLSSLGEVYFRQFDIIKAFDSVIPFIIAYIAL